MKDELSATIPKDPSTRDGPTESEPAEPPSSGGRTLGLGGLLIELVVPAAFSAALLLVLASYTAYWDLQRPVGLGIFGLLLVALSLFVSIRVDGLTLARRQRRGRKQLLNRATPRARAEQLGNAVLRAESSAARVQGIVALQTLRSGEALDQLLRILSDDPT